MTRAYPRPFPPATGLAGPSRKSNFLSVVHGPVGPPADNENGGLGASAFLGAQRRATGIFKAVKRGYSKVMCYVRFVCVALAILGALLLAVAVAAGWRSVWCYDCTRKSRIIGTWWYGEWSSRPPAPVNVWESGWESEWGNEPSQVIFPPPRAPHWKDCPAFVINRSPAGNIEVMAVAWWLLFLAWEIPLALLYLAAWKLDRRRRIRAAWRASQHAFPVNPSPPVGAASFSGVG
jgi:hypothetical protein